LRLLQAGGAKRQCQEILPRQATLDDRPLSASARVIAPPQRSSGRIDLAVKPRNGVTVLGRLHQSGPLRLRLISAERDTATTAILLNTGGGIAGGDTNRIDITAAPGTAITLSSQGAERIYRAGIGDLPSRITTRIAIGAAATLEYLPQETILFDSAALDRSLRIDLAGSARYLGIESLIFGRTAMGETIAALDLTDTVELHRDNALVFRDSLKPPRDFAAAQTHRAMFGGASAIATILLAAPDAARHLDAVRAALGDAQAGASAWNGLLLIRIMAQTGAVLRDIVLRVMNVLRGGRAMPRVWAC